MFEPVADPLQKILIEWQHDGGLLDSMILITQPNNLDNGRITRAVVGMIQGQNLMPGDTIKISEISDNEARKAFIP